MSYDFSSLSKDELIKLYKQGKLTQSLAGGGKSSFSDEVVASELNEQLTPTGETMGRLGAAYRGFYQPFGNLFAGGLELAMGKSPELDERKFLSQQKYKQAKEQYPIQTAIGSFGGDALSFSPYYKGAEAALKSVPLVKGLLNSKRFIPKTLGRGLTGAGASGMYGATLSPSEGDTRGEAALMDALIGGGIDMALPVAGAALKGMGTGIKSVYGGLSKGLSSEKALEERALRDLLSKMTQEEKEAYMRQYTTGQRAGIQQTPSEVTGSPILRDLETRAAGSQEGQIGAREFDIQEGKKRGAAVESFLNRVSPESGDYSTRVQGVVDSIIEKDMRARRRAATPLYEATYNNEVSPNKLNALLKKDGTLERVFDQVSSDPDYRRQIGKYKENQVGFLNQVVIDLGDKAQKAISGDKPDRAMYARYKKAQEDLINLMGDDYKKARAVFAEDSKPIDLLKGSPLGKIAKYKDYRVENTPKDLFNPSRFSEKDMRYAKKQIESVDPGAWRGIVRESLEDAISKGADTKTLYNAIFKDDKKYKMYYEALRGDPKALLRMRDLKQVLGNLNESLQKGIGKSEADKYQSALSFLKSLGQGRYDRAMIDLITDPALARRMEQSLNQAKKNNFGPLQDLLRSLVDEAPNQLGRGASAMQAQYRAE